MTLEAMIGALEKACGTPDAFAAQETKYQSFITAAQTEVQGSEYFGRLADLHADLSEQEILGISAIETWANGQSAFHLVPKTWKSVVDKLYRYNIEDNGRYPNHPPILATVREQIERQDGNQQLWITPEKVHLYADDLLRTKIVVPFVDGVVDVGARVQQAINASNLVYHRRFHAKDSGYHAQHYYALIPVPDYDGGETTVALEVKVLTKMQDVLGELTHLLYERHRQGVVPQEKKRKYAWQRDDSDFLAAYLGHAGHFLEASIADLKDQILELDQGP